MPKMPSRWHANSRKATMDRSEARLRELNLYPRWKQREQAVSATLEQASHLSDQQVVAEPVAANKVTVGKSESASSVVMQAAIVEEKAELSGLPDRASHISSNPIAGRLDWSQLRQQVRDCNACKLRTGCTQTVFGVGDEQADWLFIGEGPGADEDALGEPFVGQAGKLLDSMLQAIKLDRRNNAYIANVVKCRPPNNRTPEIDEISTCMPYLQRQIELIQPKIIIALGKVASNALLGKDATLASLRGILHDYHGIPVIVTYHPAYLLRSPSEKAKAWQDLCLAIDTVARQG